MSRWLLLAHQLPTRPSHARVKTWRRLQQVGAVAARNSVYVLPDQDPLREGFDRLRAEIITLGGAATVFAADVVSPDGDAPIIKLFRLARAADYRALTQKAARLQHRTRRVRGANAGTPDANRRGLITVRDRLREIEAVDFFQADGRRAALEAVRGLELQAAQRGSPGPGPAKPPRLDSAAFVARRWVTRPHPGVDRMASAWLIRRFIDPKATFAFVEHPRATDVPFDMRDVEFGHQGSFCTFETLADRFDVNDPAVTRLGHVVHDLDLKDGRFGLPETAAVGDLVDSLRRLSLDDRVTLEQGIAAFEALARSFAAGAAPSVSRNDEA